MATRKKRILSVQPVCDGGGSEHALIRMIRQLAGDGWECHVAVPAPARLSSEYAAAGAVLHVVPMPRLTTSGSAWRWAAYAARWPVVVGRLSVLARRQRVDVVHSNSLHSWYGWAVAGLVRRPHVWHAREIVFQSGLALKVERFLARHFATTVAAVSSAVAAQLDPVNVEVVFDDADRSEFRPDRAGSFRSRIGVGDRVPLVGSVARVDVWKGFDVLLDAFPVLRERVPRAELVVVGGPVAGKEAYYAQLEARAGGLDGVHWLGPRPAGDLPDLMSDLDVFVQVSTEPEPFGLVLVEALSSGVPVVAGREGGPIDVVTEPAWGRLVPPGDPAQLAAAVADLLPAATSAAKRRKRPALGQVRGQAFSDLFERAATAGRRRLRPPPDRSQPSAPPPPPT